MSGFKVQEPTLDEMLERCSLSESDSGSDAGFADAQGGEGVAEEEEAPRVEELEDESEASWKDVEEAKRSKEQGNKHYMAQELEEAVDCYSRAIAMSGRNPTLATTSSTTTVCTSFPSCSG